MAAFKFSTVQVEIFSATQKSPVHLFHSPSLFVSPLRFPSSFSLFVFLFPSLILSLFFHLLHFSFHHLIFLSSLDILLYLEVSHADIYRLWKAFRKKGEKIWCFDNSLSSLLSSPLFPQPKSAQFSFKKRKSGGKMLDLSTGSEKQMML